MTRCTAPGRSSARCRRGCATRWPSKFWRARSARVTPWPSIARATPSSSRKKSDNGRVRTRATSAALAALIAMALPAGAGCDGTPGGPLPVTTVRSAKVRIEKPTVLHGDAAVLAADNAAFALALYAALSAQAGNLVLSPASASVPMAMPSAGARTQTAPQPATTHHPFNGADGTEVSVPMMLGKAGIAMATGSGYRAAELAYAGGALSMVVIVPDAGTFATFEGDLNADRLAAILDALIVSPIGLLLPRFQFSLAISLRDTLSAMGMPLAFPPHAPDLSGIDGARDLFIRDVVEKTFIAVTERGTEAAGASGVVVATKSADPLLTVDRPFLFLIRDRPTGTLLFLGRVVDPTPSP